MSTYTFGIGYVFARRTDVTNPTPDYLGVAQSFDFSMDQSIKTLMGQFKVAVDAAGAELKITGKVKFARLQGQLLNDLLFGQTLSTGTGKQISVVVNGLPEQHAAGATVTVTQSATFSEDLGVFYAAGTTPGKQLTRVASAPAVGSYSVNESTGVYTFNASETGTLNFFYEYGVTTMGEIAIANTLMGTIPSFELHYQHYYVNNLGIANTFHIKLNACRGGKFDMPFKNTDYEVTDWDFTAFADGSGNIGTIDFTE
jgi:hypothetical protein